MSAWHFVIAAYVVGVGGTAALAAASYAAMRAAERAADALKRR
ncbi:hypothetical protein [Sphingomonas sp.]